LSTRQPCILNMFAVDFFIIVKVAALRKPL
jgi:hypothetical protein